MRVISLKDKSGLVGVIFICPIAKESFPPGLSDVSTSSLHLQVTGIFRNVFCYRTQSQAFSFAETNKQRKKLQKVN